LSRNAVRRPWLLKEREHPAGLGRRGKAKALRVWAGLLLLLRVGAEALVGKRNRRRVGYEGKGRHAPTLPPALPRASGFAHSVGSARWDQWREARLQGLIRIRVGNSGLLRSVASRSPSARDPSASLTTGWGAPSFLESEGVRIGATCRMTNMFSSLRSG
jgi:hypothetical protein